MRGHPFDVDTAVVADGPDRFGATVTDRWHALGGGPNGGYLAALCVRALAQRVDFPDPLVVSTSYLRRARVGPAELRAELLRSGRRIATGEVTLSQGGDIAAHTVASFTDFTTASGRTVLLNEPPDLPPPEQCEDLVGGADLPGVSILDQFEYRVPELPGWRRGEPSGTATGELWLRFRGGRDADLAALPLLVDATAPAVLDLGAPGSSTVQLTTHVRARPAPGWLAVRIMTQHVIGGFHEEDIELWDDDGRLVAQGRQLALLAHG